MSENETDVVTVILYATLGLIVAGLGGFGFLEWKNRQWDDEVKGIRKSLTEVGKDSAKIETLIKELQSDKLANVSGVQAYIDQMGREAGVPPSISIKKPQSDKGDGYLDQSFEVELKKADAIDRPRLARWLYKMETETFRVKTTKIQIQQDEKARNDMWAGSITVTQREPVTKAN